MRRIKQNIHTFHLRFANPINKYLYTFIISLLPALSLGSEIYEVYRGVFRNETELVGSAYLDRSETPSHSKYTLKASLNSQHCQYEVPTAEELLRISMLSDLISALNYSTLELVEVSKYVFMPFKLTSTISLNWFDCQKHPHFLKLTFNTGKKLSSDLYELELKATSNIHEQQRELSATARIVVPFSHASNNVFFSFTELLWGTQASALRNITPSVLAPASHSLSLFTEATSTHDVYTIDPLVQPQNHNEIFLHYYLTAETFNPAATHPLGTLELLRRQLGTEYERKLLGWRLSSGLTHNSLLYIRSYFDLKQSQRRTIKSTASSSHLTVHKREKSNSDPDLETLLEKEPQEFRRQRSKSMTSGAVYVPAFVSFCQAAHTLYSHSTEKPNTIYSNKFTAQIACEALANGIYYLLY
ncbi:MAG: hypothetical protein ACR2PX_10085 [Endozoicomonas sp.]|uniref:hypothetical protein n=1 Tax=Endozoicomonas sp. TaxID=1892382 RepID=UPI003D9BBAD0